MKTSRWLAVLAALLVAAPHLADARVGGGGGAGSRGTRTFQAPAPTQTAPRAAPIERSATPSQPTRPTTSATAQAAPQTGGFFSRHPFLGGLMGGMLGAGLFGMMFGSGFGGGAGLFGLVFQLLLIGGLAWLAVRFFRSRAAAPGQSGGQTARSPYAFAAPLPAPPVMDAPPATGAARSSVPLTGGGGGGGDDTPLLAITKEDYSAFESLLGEIQAAFSAGDLARLRGLVTPEMLGYFSEQLSANASRGVENKVEAVKLEQGDLAEAWSEADLDYATVAMRFSLIDVTRRIADGTVVEGDPQARSEATEVWTFLRSRGGKWILSAIQQG